MGLGTSFPVSNEWVKYVFSVDDLPPDKLAEIMVGFDLIGPGEVWIDNVQTFDLAFTQSEQHELTKIIGLASYHLRSRNISDCVRVLDGYWPRYLMKNVDPPFVQMAIRPERERPSPDSEPSQPPADNPSWFDRLKNVTPRWWK